MHDPKSLRGIYFNSVFQENIGEKNLVYLSGVARLLLSSRVSLLVVNLF